MRICIAVAIAALFATGSAFAQNDQQQPKKAPTQVAQASGGGMATGAGEATGVAGTGLSAGGVVAVAAGAAVVVAASGSNNSTVRH